MDVLKSFTMRSTVNNPTGCLSKNGLNLAVFCGLVIFTPLAIADNLTETDSSPYFEGEIRYVVEVESLDDRLTVDYLQAQYGTGMTKVVSGWEHQENL